MENRSFECEDLSFSQSDFVPAGFWKRGAQNENKMLSSQGLKWHDEKLHQKTKGKEKTFQFNEVNFLSQSHGDTGSENMTYMAPVAAKPTGLD